MSFHANDWLSVLLGLLGTYQQAKTSGATPQETQDAVIAAGLAIATHVMTPPAAPAVAPEQPTSALKPLTDHSQTDAGG